MSRQSIIVISIALTSILAIAALASCARTASPQQPQPAATPTETTKKTGDLRILTFENPRMKIFISEWWPTEVIKVTKVENGVHKGDWIIEVRNVSDKPIKSVAMQFEGPHDCEAFVMTPGLLIGLGEDNQYLTRMASPALVPGATDKIVVQRQRVDEIIPPQELKGCPPEKSYFYLKLESVNYADGTVWNARKDPNAPNQNN
jgi:hypothetical protein